MACEFDMMLKEAPSVYLAKAKSAVEKLKGSFQGDEHSGKLSVNTMIGNISASYTITEGKIMHIRVLEKPFFLSCDKIKTVLQEYIG